MARQRQRMRERRPYMVSGSWGVVVLKIAIVASLILAAHTASAQNRRDTMFTRSFGGRDVLSVQTDLELSPLCSFGVAKVVVSCNKPSSRDRDLVLVLYVSSYGTRANMGAAYRVPLRLAEGKSRVDIEIPHVQDAQTVFWDMGIFEDQRDIEDQQKNVAAGRNAGPHYDNNERHHFSLSCLLAKGEMADNFLKFATHLENEVYATTQLQNRVGLQAPVISIGAASRDWRTYHASSCWVVSPQAVAEINQSQALSETLRKYLSSGGQLLVHSVEDGTLLSTVDELLDIDEQSVSGWLPETEINSEPADETNSQTEPLFDKTQVMDALTDNKLLSRAYVLGRVHISARPVDALKSILDYQSIQRRNGGATPFSSEVDGSWFWRNLIRAVGKPPIWMFCGIVTLFGALLGPGLLYFTGRLQRRSLMIFLVPVISMVATLAIVSYSVVHEGFDTHLRVTSVQAIDSGRSFVWSRQNYFSGMPPRAGLSFTTDTYARPVLPDDSSNYRYAGNPRKSVEYTVTQLPDEQNWSGWLRPRQQQQLLIGHAVKSTQLPIAIQRANKNQVLLTNVSKAHLPIVLLRGEADDYYLAEELGPSKSASINAIDKDAASAMVAKRMVDYRPESPPELGEGGSLLDFGSVARRRRAVVGLHDSDDVLNAQFQRWLSDKLEVPKFGFSILTTESDVVEVPLEGKSSENLHLIIGARRW